MCAEGMGCGRRKVIWVLLGTGTASWRPDVSWRILLTISVGSLFQNGTSVLVTAGITYLVVDVIDLDGLDGEFRKAMGDLEHDY